VVYSYNAFPEIDLQKEMRGASNHIKSIAALSGESGGAVFCGIKTRLLGEKNIGAAVCNKGRLVDIVDRTSNPLADEYETSNRLKIFATGKGRIGLLLDTDCILERNWEKSAPHADIMLCLNRRDDEGAREEVRLFSAAYQIPYLYVDEEGIEWKSS
jgi:hypothetical protein